MAFRDIIKNFGRNPILIDTRVFKAIAVGDKSSRRRSFLW